MNKLFTPGLRARWRKHCMDKRFYETAEEADLAMISAILDGVFDGRAGFYKCSFCAGWHTTSKINWSAGSAEFYRRYRIVSH